MILCKWQTLNYTIFMQKLYFYFVPFFRSHRKMNKQKIKLKFNLAFFTVIDVRSICALKLLKCHCLYMYLSCYMSTFVFFFYSVSSRQHINEIESLLVYICDQCYISCVCVRVQEEKIIGARWRCCLFDYTHVHRQCRTSDVLRIQCYVVWQLSRWLTSLHQ